jgi:hypothetical protein
MDMEFEKVKTELGLVDVNTTAAREHVAEIERGIRLLKERARCVVKSLPFQYLPKQIVIHLVYFVCMMVNAIPAAEGISQLLSPREIVTQRKIDFRKDCKALFGSYVEASTDAIVTNDMKSRTHSCIALGPSGN